MKAAVIELAGAGPALEKRLARTLADLASIGEKRAGTAGGAASAAYLLERFHAAGLEQVHPETFRFRAFALRRSSLQALKRPIAHQALAYCGCGSAEAPLVHVGSGEPADYDGRDVAGRIALVERNVTFHRSAQYREAVARGAVALLHVSHAPENLVQLGTVADPEDGLGPVPALSVGERDGRELIAAARGSGSRASLSVEAELEPARGNNVVGHLPGEGPALLVGAHHDTWHVGSTDNGTGVAVLLELAAQLSRVPRRRKLVFVAWDGEELGLFGGYDYLRKHLVEGREPTAAFVNLEIPGAGPDDIRALAHTSALEGPLRATALDELYPVCVGMEMVPAMFGGVIPTDIQGLYRFGVPGASTACDTPWYHTSADTPDKVHLPFLAQATARWRRALATLDALPDDEFGGRDPHLWALAAVTSEGQAGLHLDLRAARADGKPAGGARVEVWLDVDDFTRVFHAGLSADAAGAASLTIPREALHRGTSGRYLHVTAGESWPLVERILPLR
ncbi:MAG TPA: M28 family peptidase [Myxococcales bacterium]|nr:M28 family peptidase [Myxococcales bacterium]